MLATVYFKSSDDYNQAIVGESNYQSQIDKAFQEGGKFIDVALILEPHNKFDQNAVAIAYGSDTLGYLSRTDALIYRHALIKTGHPNAMGMCKAKIVGGGEDRSYGIILDLDIQSPQIERVVLPPQPDNVSKTSPTVKAKSTKKISPLLIAIIAICVVLSCIGAAIDLISRVFENAGYLPTRTPAPTATKYIGPLEQMYLTQTAQPTNTPPAPTDTPLPTATSTPLPQPITLTGSGDSIVDVAKWAGPAIMHAKYGGSGNFIVQNYGSDNESIDLLINTIGAYDGIVPIDFLDNQNTARFEVKASGPWELLISPLADARKFDLPATITGTGDDVVVLQGGNADTIKADNSSGDGNFIVMAYGTSDYDLIFNEIAPYTGTALLSSDTFVLTIKATNNWALEVTAK